MIRVIIADDHEVYLDGLEVLLEKAEDMKLVARAQNGRELIAFTKEFQPDVVVADLRMPDMTGIEAIKQLHELDLSPASIIISMFGDEHLVVEAAEAGILGYVTKGARKEELTEAIRVVHAKKFYYCNRTATKLIGYLYAKSGKPVPLSMPYLTEEDKEIIRLICEGMTSKEIGERLFKGRRTVELARSRILEKIQGKSSVDIVKFAISHGLYSIDQP